MLLNTTARKIQIVLAGAVTTNECPISAYYIDSPSTGAPPTCMLMLTTGTTPVDVIPAPPTDVRRKPVNITIQNTDTAAITVTVRYLDTSTPYQIVKITLAVGETLAFTDSQGWRATDVNGAMKTSTGSGGGAPTDASYLVGAANATLTAERVVTDTATIAWDLATAGQAKADVPNAAVTYAKIQDVSAASRILGRGSAAGAGDVEELTVGAGLSLSGTALSATGGSTPTGTGFRHVVAGVEDAAAKLVDTADVNDGQVTLAKIDTLASDRLIGRDTTGAGVPEALTVGGGLEFTGSGGIQRSELTGDVTASAGSGATTIANDAVTLAKMADVATARILGRVTISTGDPEALTITQALDLADATRGTVLSRGATAWVGIDPGTATYVLTSNGAGADPSYQVIPAAGGSAALTRINGSSGAAGADITWQKLSANATANATTTPVTVMTTIGVGAGTWAFKYLVRYQSSVTTTGVGFCVNHTGTTGAFVSSWWFVSTGAAAATGVADQVSVVITGQMMEGKSERAKNTVSSASAGVDTINVDMLAIMEGVIVVTVSGDLQLKHSSETANSTQVMADSCLMLQKIG